MVCLEERLEAVENRQSSNSGAVHQLLDELAAAAADQEGADKGIGSVTELYDLPEGSRASSLRRPHALDLLRFNSRSSHAQSNTRKRSMSISGTSPSARVKWQEEDDKHEDGTSSKGHDAKSLRSNKSERSASDLEMAGGISETDEQQLSRHTPPRGSAAAAAAAAAVVPAADPAAAVGPFVPGAWHLAPFSHLGYSQRQVGYQAGSLLGSSFAVLGMPHGSLPPESLPLVQGVDLPCACLEVLCVVLSTPLHLDHLPSAVLVVTTFSACFTPMLLLHKRVRKSDALHLSLKLEMEVSNRIQCC
mmetsp:Transcript_22764/g.59502  ORF Transcript_22764/g.59502 Transcript_22764/m.59502 type:complete len:304 (-) Transcript_22764:1277-2188(-)